ncbi:MAG: TRAP transporter fused permease subunit, partial [Desulfobacteraceae bacterium]|nr:TRAP transporter fused permease subunit [Desulfobacteraceae bacterium]
MNSTQPEVSRFRTLSLPWRLLTKGLLIGLSVVGTFFILDVPFYLGWSILREQYYAIFLSMVLGCVFLLVPPTKKAARDRVSWYDALLSLLSFSVGLYLVLFYRDILWSLDLITPDRIIMGSITIVLILEGVRRLTGWILPILGVIFILYARFSWLVPGMFGGPGMSWDRLVNYLFLDTNALLGIPIMVATVIVLPLILFGNLLFSVGGGKFFINITMCTLGRFRGGPAKIAVMASTLFGAVSGSAVANVATTGVMTIPLMKRMGYEPHIAAAIEAVASTGGQLVPPIMGAAIFMMAEFTGIPYREIVIAAMIPAALYYLSIFTQVHLEAVKTGLKGLPQDELPPIRGVLRQSYLFLVPLAVLIYALFILWLTPGKAALLAAFSILLLSFFQRHTRFHLAWLGEALEKTGRALLELTLIVALASLVIGVINATGLGFVLSLFLGQLAEENVFLLLFIVAGASIILGMGLPTTCLYILLAVLMAPSLIEA